jgi:phage terminase small subunit
VASKVGNNNEQGLTDLEERFCLEYVRDLNGGRAVIRAGYNVKDMNSASVQASRMLRKPKIREYLSDAFDLNEITIISEIIRIALSQLTDVVEFDGENIKVLPTKDWTERTKSAVKSIKVTRTTTARREGKATVETTVTSTEVTMHDKLSALDKLMKKFGLYNKQIALLDAVQILLNEGVATPEQAQIISDGVNNIQQKMKENGIENS